MPASAYLFPIVSRLEWERSRVPASTLTAVDPFDPIDVGEYAARDGELAYRDLTVAAALSRVATSVSDIWGFDVERPTMSGSPAADLKAGGLTVPACPGSVTYVDNQSYAYDAVTTDEQLYARDLVLYQSIYATAAEALVDRNPISPLTGVVVTVGDAWSFADSLEQEVGVGYNLPFNPSLFKSPDQHLAWRDNVVAGYAARLKLTLGRVWSLAQRILLQVVDDRGVVYEPETYSLLADDGRYRSWGAAPRVPGQLLLVYDKSKNTVSWVGERTGIAGSPQVAGTSVVIGGALITRQPDLQPVSDSEYYRQKSSRLVTQYFTDNTIYSTVRPNDYILTGGQYQVDSAMLTVPSVATFALPIVVPAGCVRLGLLVRPAANFGVLGFQNTAGIADGSAATITTAQTLYWGITLPAGRLYYSLTLTDKTAKTPAFAVRVRYNSAIIFDGSYVFNQEPGTSYETQSVEFDADGLPAVFSVEWLGGDGALTIESVNFVVNAATQTANYGLGVQLNDIVARPVNFLGVSERLDVVLFDLVVPSELISPTLVINWIGGGSLVLFVHGYDVKVFDLVEPVPNPSNYEPYKASLIQAAGDSVAAAYGRYVAANPTVEFRASDSLLGYVWNSATYAAWLTALNGSGEPRIESAFQLAGPSDLGRPAIVPEGLEVSGGTTVKANYGLVQGSPKLRALQPWMLMFGARVAGPDFWPLNHPGCSWYGPLSTISVDTYFEVSSVLGSPAGPHINNLTMTQLVDGTPSSVGNRAITITNSGPSGGAISQTVEYLVWMSNLRVGSVYTLTVTIVTALVSQSIGSGTTTTSSLDFTATATSQSYAPPVIAAASGYQVWLQSVALS